MTDDEVLAEFRDAGALLEGHFILSSGRRSAVFLQKMFIFQDPVRTERVCKALAAKIEAAMPIDMAGKKLRRIGWLNSSTTWPRWRRNLAR